MDHLLVIVSLHDEVHCLHLLVAHASLSYIDGIAISGCPARGLLLKQACRFRRPSKCTTVRLEVSGRLAATVGMAEPGVALSLYPRLAQGDHTCGIEVILYGLIHQPLACDVSGTASVVLGHWPADIA